MMQEIDLKIVGEYIKRLCKAKKLTQDQLAERGACSRKYPSAVEDGEKPSIESSR